MSSRRKQCADAPLLRDKKHITANCKTNAYLSQLNENTSSINRHSSTPRYKTTSISIATPAKTQSAAGFLVLRFAVNT